MKKIYSKILFMMLLLMTVSAVVSAQKTLLFIGRETLGQFQMDQDLYDSLISWGYTLNYISSADYGTATADVYNGNDGVFMDETVNSSDMTNFGTRDDYPLPIIDLEGFTPRSDRWAWLTDNNTQFYQAADGAGTEESKSIVIKDDTHYITKIYDKDEVVAWSTSTGTDVGGTRPVSIMEADQPYSAFLAKDDAIADQADFWTMITIDSSETFPHNLFLWGVVGAGIDGASQTEHYGTQDFFTIIRRACEWAFSLEQEGPTAVASYRLNDIGLTAFPNPASVKATIRFNVPMTAEAVVTLNNIAGQQLDVLLDKKVQPGNNFVFLDVTNLHPGVYIIRLKVDQETRYTKLVVR